MDNMAPKFRRKQYFVAAKFQTRYIGLILALMFLAVVMCSYVVYYSMMVTMGEKLATVYPQGRLISIVNMVNLRILLVFLMITPFVVIIGIYLSHKIAGPIFRMERFLGRVASGDLSQRLTLRKGDELVNLAEGINKVIESVKASLAKEKDHMQKVCLEAQNLKNAVEARQADPSKLKALTEVICKESECLSNEFKRYKV